MSKSDETNVQKLVEEAWQIVTELQQEHDLGEELDTPEPPVVTNRIRATFTPVQYDLMETEPRMLAGIAARMLECATDGLDGHLKSLSPGDPLVEFAHTLASTAQELEIIEHGE